MLNDNELATDLRSSDDITATMLPFNKNHPPSYMMQPYYPFHHPNAVVSTP